MLLKNVRLPTPNTSTEKDSDKHQRVWKAQLELVNGSGNSFGHKQKCDHNCLEMDILDISKSCFMLLHMYYMRAHTHWARLSHDVKGKKRAHCILSSQCKTHLLAGFII